MDSPLEPKMTVDTPTIFFSYARADAEFALKLANDLRSAGVNLWIDQLDIPAGDRWDIAVGNALKASPRLLLVLSPAAVESQNVMDEVAFALESNKNIVPVLHRRCDIPFRIRRLQYLDFTFTYDGGFTQLLRTLHAPQVVGGGQTAPDITRIKCRMSSRRFIYPSAILLLVIMVGVGLAHWLYGVRPVRDDTENFTGRWHRQLDNVTWVITENNGFVTGTLDASNFTHTLNATKSSSRLATGPVRRINRTNGCETVMSYEMNMIDPQHIRIRITGTDGRCDIPRDYREDFVWDRQ